MTNKYTVKELVEAISSMSVLDYLVVCAILGGRVGPDMLRVINSYRNLEASSNNPTLMKAIANWDYHFPAHKDDAILTLLDELLEDALCQQQPGKETEEAR